MKVIIGKLNTTALLNEAVVYLESLGYKRHAGGPQGDKTAIRLIGIGDEKRYMMGTYDRYVNYLHNNVSVYEGYSIKSLEEFKAIKSTPMQKVETIVKESYTESKTTRTSDLQPTEDIIVLKKSNVINAYNKVSPELKQFLVFICGDRNMFIQQTYKIGDKFKRGTKTYVIAKVNTNVVTLLDCDTFENFCNSKQVKDMNHISESELQTLLGTWYHLFELVK